MFITFQPTPSFYLTCDQLKTRLKLYGRPSSSNMSLGDHSVAIGASNWATEEDSVAIGIGNKVISKRSIAFGRNNFIDASGENAIAIGKNLNVKCSNCFIVGTGHNFVNIEVLNETLANHTNSINQLKSSVEQNELRISQLQQNIQNLTDDLGNVKENLSGLDFFYLNRFFYCSFLLFGDDYVTDDGSDTVGDI